MGGIYNATGGWSASQNTVNFVAGFGDTLSFGATSAIRDMAGINGGVSKCSTAYGYGGYLGIAVGGSISLGATTTRATFANWLRNGRASNTTARPWSHWIPDRYIRPLTGRGNPNPDYKRWLDVPGVRHFINSPFNGNVVSRNFHALTDNLAWRFLPRANKSAVGGKPLNKWFQQPLRVPAWLGAGTATSMSKAMQSECGC